MQVQCVRKSQTAAYDMQVSKSDPTTLLKKLTSNECVNLVLASAQAEIQCRKRLHMGGAIWSAGSHMVEYPLAWPEGLTIVRITNGKLTADK
jgi:hypothetical protein